MIFELACYDRAVAVETDLPEVEAILPGYLPPSQGAATRRARRRYRVARDDAGAYVVSCGQRLVWKSPDAVGACEGVEGDLNLYVAENAPGHVFVHAGVVAWAGRAIVLPGRTFSGKSSLVAALLRAGASYLSDEFAPLDAEGCVHPFPRPLKLRDSAGLNADRVNVAESRCWGSPLPLGVVAAMRYQPQVGWECRGIPWGAAMLAMLENTVPARSRPRRVRPALNRALQHARCFCGTRGDADDAARRLLEIAGR